MYEVSIYIQLSAKKCSDTYVSTTAQDKFFLTFAKNDQTYVLYCNVTFAHVSDPTVIYTDQHQKCSDFPTVISCSVMEQNK